MRSQMCVFGRGRLKAKLTIWRRSPTWCFWIRLAKDAIAPFLMPYSTCNPNISFTSVANPRLSRATSTASVKQGAISCVPFNLPISFLKLPTSNLSLSCIGFNSMVLGICQDANSRSCPVSPSNFAIIGKGCSKTYLSSWASLFIKLNVSAILILDRRKTRRSLRSCELSCSGIRIRSLSLPSFQFSSL